MKILYKDKEIEEICTVYREANRKYGIDLKGGLRLIFEPIGNDLFKPDGGLDWRKVTTIQMISVEDTHE